MSRNRVQFSIEAKDNASRTLRDVDAQTKSLTSSIQKLAATALAGLSTKAVAEYAETWRLTANRIKLVTENTAELNTVQRELVDLSMRSRTSFEATANLYARVARSSKDLGLSQQELLDFTETVSKSIRVSGSTAAEASAGVIQFGQALASSRLSGDELRSVLEQMPRLARAIADGMGVGIGELRELGEAGALTSDVVLEALRKSAPAIEEEFQRLTPLVSEALTNLQTALMSTIGAIDEASGFSATLAESMIDAAEQVELLGSALTGELTADQLKEISGEASTAAFAILSVSFALSTMVDGLQTSTAPVKQFFSSLVSRLMDVNTLYEGGEIANAVKFAWDDAGDAALKSVEENNEDILNSWDELLRKFKNIQGEAFKRDDVDLDEKGTSPTIVTRAEREAIAKAAKSLDDFQQKLFDQADALSVASQEGIKYSDALQIVKLRTAAATSGQVELGENLIDAFKAVSDEAEVFAANKTLEELQETLIQQGEAFGIVRDEALTFAQAMEIVKVRAVALAAGNEELGENLIAVMKEMNIQQNELAAKLNFAEKMAERAAENMQDAFAEFFFDPFEEGLRGLLLSFINVIRKMIAESMALKTAHIFDFSKFFLNTAKGIDAGGTTGDPEINTRAAGGNASGLTAVGERGVELLDLPRNTRVINNSAAKAMGLGAPTFVTNIDARGADPGLIARLPQILDQRDRRLMMVMKRYQETGEMPI